MNQDDFDYQVALRDCHEKLAALPARLQAEFDSALEERRKPFPILPITAIRADLVCAAIAKIGTVPETKVGSITLKAICRDQASACKRHGSTEVGLYSEQLAAILDAAGIKLKEPIVAHV